MHLVDPRHVFFPIMSLDTFLGANRSGSVGGVKEEAGYVRASSGSKWRVIRHVLAFTLGQLMRLQYSRIDLLLRSLYISMFGLIGKDQ